MNIKKLEFKQTQYGMGVDTPVGTYLYRVDVESGEVVVHWGKAPLRMKSIDEAKEIIQNDFEDKIKKCLEYLEE